jgi:hypothetical protein
MSTRDAYVQLQAEATRKVSEAVSESAKVCWAIENRPRPKPVVQSRKLQTVSLNSFSKQPTVSLVGECTDSEAVFLDLLEQLSKSAEPLKPAASLRANKIGFGSAQPRFDARDDSLIRFGA